MINEKAVSRAQQKFFGMVRARQKGKMQNASPEVEKAAASMKKSDVKDFASTKHKGLPEKKKVEEAKDYKEKDKIMKRAKPLHNHLYKNLHKGDTKGDVNEASLERRFCELCGKKEFRDECSYGPKMWDMFTVGSFSRDIECRKEHYDWRKNFGDNLEEAYLRVQERGKTYTIVLNWRGRKITTQMFFPKFSRPSKDEVKAEIHKVYPNAMVLYYNPTFKDPTLPLLFAGEKDEPR